MHFVESLVAAAGGALFDWGGCWQFTAVGLWFAFWARGRAVAKAGRNRAAQMAALSGPHEFGPVRASDFHWLDLRHYSEMERRLAAMGFRNLGDVENLSLSAAFPWLRTAVRELTSGDGILTVAIWQVKVRGWRRMLSFVGFGKGDVRLVDIGTEFSDGVFVSTANTRGLAFSSEVPGIERLGFSDETPIEEMVAAHRKRVAVYLASHPGTLPMRVRTARELRQSVTRAHELKCAEMARTRTAELRQFAGVEPAVSSMVQNSPGSCPLSAGVQLNQLATSAICSSSSRCTTLSA